MKICRFTEQEQKVYWLLDDAIENVFQKLLKDEKIIDADFDPYDERRSVELTEDLAEVIARIIRCAKKGQ